MSEMPSPWWEFLTNPVISGALGAGLGALGSIVGAVFTRGPAIQQQINESFEALMEASEKRISALVSEVKYLREDVVILNGHVEKLNETIQNAGLVAPPLTRRPFNPF